MDVEGEINALAAQHFALQFVVTQTLVKLSRLGPHMRDVVAEAFDEAADIAQSTAIYLGKSVPAEHSVKALRAIEELRAVVLGNQEKPKHAV